MSGYTPGPWEAHYNGHYWDITVGGTYAPTTATVHANAVELRPDEETEANARLVAAAPELLEALKEMMRFADHGKRFDDSLLSDEGQAMSAARAALRKAAEAAS